VNSIAKGLDQAAGWSIGANERARWISGIAKWILVFNLFDGVFTMVWVQYSFAIEWNVLLRDLVHGDMVLFMAVKLTLVSLGTLFLWRYRNYPLAVVALFVAFVAYFLVFLYHLQYSTLLLLR
jgi:hypothetical protein